jgi:hypothetical protein
MMERRKVNRRSRIPPVGPVVPGYWQLATGNWVLGTAYPITVVCSGRIL